MNAQEKNRKQTLETILNNHYLRLQQQMAARTRRMRRKPPTPPTTPGMTVVEIEVEEEVGEVATKEEAGIGGRLGVEVGAVEGAEVGVGVVEGAEVDLSTTAGAEVEVGATEGKEVVKSTILIRLLRLSAM